MSKQPLKLVKISTQLRFSQLSDFLSSFTVLVSKAIALKWLYRSLWTQSLGQESANGMPFHFEFKKHKCSSLKIIQWAGNQEKKN